MYSVYSKLRDSNGLSDYKVAQDLGISRAMFTEWKKGKYSPKADKLQKLADYFGVTVEYLMTGEMGEGYYLNQETANIAQQIFESKELSMLFDVGKDMSPEDLQTIYQMALALKRKESN